MCKIQALAHSHPAVAPDHMQRKTCYLTPHSDTAAGAGLGCCITSGCSGCGANLSHISIDIESPYGQPVGSCLHIGSWSVPMLYDPAGQWLACVALAGCGWLWTGITILMPTMANDAIRVLKTKRLIFYQPRSLILPKQVGH